MPHVISGEETTWWKIRCSPLRRYNLEEERQNSIMQKRMGENSTGFIMLSCHMHLFFFCFCRRQESVLHISICSELCLFGFPNRRYQGSCRAQQNIWEHKFFVLCWCLPLISQWSSLQKSVAHRISFEGASGTALVCRTQGYWNNSTKTWHIIRLRRY